MIDLYRVCQKKIVWVRFTRAVIDTAVLKPGVTTALFAPDFIAWQVFQTVRIAFRPNKRGFRMTTTPPK